jgi:TRAP-type uncharacterized transport system fused permease subunit
MGPALVELGIQVLAAHLFIQYFGTLSMFTPPICLAAYAAGSIAEAPPMRTAFNAVRIGILAYPVPFLFVYSQTFLLMGPPGHIALAVLTAFFGTFLIGCAAVGYLFRKLGLQVRLALAIAGVALLIPASDQHFAFGLLTDVGGVCLSVPLLLREWRARQNVKESKIYSSDAYG